VNSVEGTGSSFTVWFADSADTGAETHP
jgi:hypothetical protein